MKCLSNLFLFVPKFEHRTRVCVCVYKNLALKDAVIQFIAWTQYYTFYSRMNDVIQSENFRYVERRKKKKPVVNSKHNQQNSRTNMERNWTCIYYVHIVMTGCCSCCIVLMDNNSASSVRCVMFDRSAETPR